MRRHNEGYALLFVLVILTVLFVVVSLILPTTIRNHEAQLNSIQMMKDKYEAQGAIEMLVAKLENWNKDEEWYRIGILEVELTSLRAQKSNEIIDVACSKINEASTYKLEYDATASAGKGELTKLDGTEGVWKFEFPFQISSTYRSAKVTCEMTLTEIFTVAGRDDAAGADAYVPTRYQAAYVVYDISRVETGGTE